MSTNDSKPEPGILEVFEEKLVQGQRLAEKNDLTGGRVNFWTASLKHPLRRLFGGQSKILESWIALDQRVPTLKAKETIAARLATLGTIVDMIRNIEMASAACGGRKRVFIGHGRSPVWRELKDFLHNRLGLEWDEFNRESVAGLPTTERLTQMLNDASFAFLVMTAEDEHADATLHARANVIHEVGLFQGRLGQKRAIIVREEGCSLFSNIHGLSIISFPPGNVSAAFEEIRRVLEREGVIAP